VLAATPHATHEYTEVDLTQGVALVVGTEQVGLSDAWMKEADPAGAHSHAGAD
jgi:TrmH family RNA methyltransferase